MGSADWGAPPGTPTLSTTWQTISTNPRVAMSVKTVKRPSYYRYTNPDPPHTPPFEKGYVLDHLADGSAQDKLELGKEAAKGGLGIVTAAIFLSGEMAGSGVLALPAAFLGTGGILGMILIVLFTLNAGFSGTRLGLCWIMLEERYEEFRGEVRDPYPAIAEKAFGKAST